MATVFDDPKRQRTITYVVLGVLALGAILTGILIFNNAKANRDAEAKAQQLSAAFVAAGLPAPDTQQIARTLGTDGGAVCADPTNALKRAILFAGMTNGAAGPGQRPIIADSRVVQGERMVLQVYCPEQVPAFDEYVSDLTFDDVIKE